MQTCYRKLVAVDDMCLTDDCDTDDMCLTDVANRPRHQYHNEKIYLKNTLSNRIRGMTTAETLGILSEI